MVDDVFQLGNKFPKQHHDQLGDHSAKLGANQLVEHFREHFFEFAKLVRCETLGVGTAFAALVYATCQPVLAWNDRRREN